MAEPDTGSPLPWRTMVAAAALAAAVALVLHALAVARTGTAVDGTIDWRSLEDAAVHEGASAAPLRFAIAPVVSPESSLRGYQALVDEVGRRCRRPARFITRSGYAEIGELLRQRQCDLALVCTYVYVRGQHDYGLAALAAPVVRGATAYHSEIIVPAGSPVGGLLDLGGRRFASSDLLSTSGWVWPAQWLREQGRDPGAFLGRHLVTGSHDRSVEAVLRGQADGAAVDSIVLAGMAAADPQVAAGVRVVQRSPPFGMPPVVCHPLLDPALRQELSEALLGLHRDPAGRAALAQAGFDRFAVPDEALYDGVRATAAAWDGR